MGYVPAGRRVVCDVGGGKIAGVRADPRWEFALEHSVSCAPAIGSDGTVYVGSGGEVVRRPGHGRAGEQCVAQVPRGRAEHRAGDAASPAAPRHQPATEQRASRVGPASGAAIERHAGACEVAGRGRSNESVRGRTGQRAAVLSVATTKAGREVEQAGTRATGPGGGTDGTPGAGQVLHQPRCGCVPPIPERLDAATPPARQKAWRSRTRLPTSLTAKPGYRLST